MREAGVLCGELSGPRGSVAARIRRGVVTRLGVLAVILLACAEPDPPRPAVAGSPSSATDSGAALVAGSPSTATDRGAAPIAGSPSTVTDSGPAPAAPAGDTTPFARFVGLRYVGAAGLPAGLREEGGTVLTDSTGAEYGLLEITDGTARMLWLNRFVGRDSAGKPRWEVLAVLRRPAMREGESLVTALCEQDGTRDPEIFAIVDRAAEPADVERYTRIRRAWRADLERGRIEEIPMAGITCTNEAGDV